jgi:hypothetical protein
MWDRNSWVRLNVSRPCPGIAGANGKADYGPNGGRAPRLGERGLLNVRIGITRCPRNRVQANAAKGVCARRVVGFSRLTAWQLSVAVGTPVTERPPQSGRIEALLRDLAESSARVCQRCQRRCDRRHKLLFEYPMIFWTTRASLDIEERVPGVTAMVDDIVEGFEDPI